MVWVFPFLNSQKVWNLLIDRGDFMKRRIFGPKTWLYPMPVLIIGTYDENGNPNAMNAAWGGIYDYNQITISLGAHRTTNNIRKNKAFTVSVGTRKTLEICDYVGLVSQDKVKDKITKAGLHPVKSELINAPLFEEFPFTLECKLISLDGEENEGGTLIGQIINVAVDPEILNGDNVDIKKLEPIAFDPVNNEYLLLSEKAGDAFKAGLKLK